MGYRLLDNHGNEILNVRIPAQTLSAYSMPASPNGTVQAESRPAGSNLTVIEGPVFADCENITSVILPLSTQTLNTCDVLTDGSGVFQNCIALEDININDMTQLQEIGDYTFKNCIALAIDVSFDYDCLIGYYAFMNSGITSFSLTGQDPGFVPVFVGGGAFMNCTDLLYAVLMNVGEITADVFSGCTSMTRVNLDSTLTKINTSAFNNCTSLTTINFNGTVSDWQALEIVGDWNNCNLDSRWYNATLLVHCSDGDTPLFDLGYELTSSDFNLLGYRAEYYSSGNKLYDLSTGNEVVNVVIPDTVIKDGQTVDVKRIASQCFKNFTNIESVQIGNNITRIDNQAFYNCTSLESVSLPSNLKYIGNNAFAQCNLVNGITLPNGLTTIGLNAFRNANLTGALTIPDTVISLGESAFYQNNITYLTLETYRTNLKEIPYYCFASNKTMIGSLIIPDSVETLGDYCFEASTINNVDLDEIIIGDGVKTIGAHAFTNRQYCPDLYLGSSVEEIGDYAFAYMEALTDLTLLDGVKKLGSYIIHRDTGITSLTIPDTVEELGDYCLYQGSHLTSLTLSANLKNIGAYALKDCHSIIGQDIDLEKIEEIGTQAFFWVPASRFKIGKNIVSVGTDIFQHSTTTLQQYNPTFTEIEFYGTVSEWQALDNTIKTNIKNALLSSVVDVICSDGTTTII